MRQDGPDGTAEAVHEASNERTATPYKYIVPSTTATNKGLMMAAKKRMDPTEVIQRATIRSLIAQGYISKKDAERIKLLWRLSTRLWWPSKRLAATEASVR
jgi:hypothetical protein